MLNSLGCFKFCIMLIAEPLSGLKCILVAVTSLLKLQIQRMKGELYLIKNISCLVCIPFYETFFKVNKKNDLAFKVFVIVFKL